MNSKLFKAFVSLAIILCSFTLSSQEVTGLILVNSDTNQDIKQLNAYDTIDVAVIGSNLNIRTEVTGEVTEVVFALNDNENFRTEGTAPFTMAGDENGNYLTWTPVPATYIIKATPKLNDAEGASLTSSLVIINSKDIGASGTVYELPSLPGNGEVTITGELKKWHPITLSFDGPAYNETDIQPSPFLDYRLNVTFTNGTLTYTVPGYFAADGNAAETSADSGNVWRVHFSPSETGTWNYNVSFRLEGHAAINSNIDIGLAVAPMDGINGSFNVVDTDKDGKDNRAKGRLTYVNDHYLQYAETKESFLKAGADSPENFLAYDDFDNTSNTGGLRKNWEPHKVDYRPGDPTWKDGKGTEIIGAVNYLASKGLNVFSFLTMNINGDDKNVYPYTSNNNYYAFDCSKLDQWEIVFSHGDSLGMFLHFKTQETENEMLLDNGDLGPQRKLYYRELIARYAHHLALNWNLGEENGHYGETNQNDSQRKEMAQYFFENDPYKNHIVIHTAPDKISQIYTPLLGSQSALTGVSIQTGWDNSYTETLKWREASAQAKKRWVIAHDEQNSHKTGVPQDSYTGTPNKDDIRKQTLWGNFMAGGTGVEYYFGYELPESDLSCQDWRFRDKSWDYASYALSFFRSIPVNKMTPNNDLVETGWCLAYEGNTYAIYLQKGGSADIYLSTNATYKVSWFNPRTGEGNLTGNVSSISGSGKQSIGNPPSDVELDWAAIVQIDTTINKIPTAMITADTLSGYLPLSVSFSGNQSSDSDGAIVGYDWDFDDGVIAKADSTVHTFLEPGVHRVSLTVYNEAGIKATATCFVTVLEDKTNYCGEYIELFSKDFPYSGTDFYLDEFTDFSLLAIEPTPPDTATASVVQNFNGETCTYDITFHAIGENDGQSRFTLLVAGNEIGSYDVPLSTDSWEMGDKYNFTWNEVSVTNGDEIKVIAETGTDGAEWSRARWLKLEFAPSKTEICEYDFNEENGLVILEAENLNVTSLWSIQNSVAGYTDYGYIVWLGSDNFGTPGIGTIEQQIKINTPGTYGFQWHCKVGHGTDPTESNDTWLRFPDATKFYATRSAGDSVYPHGICTNNCPEGAGKDGWFKVFSSGTVDWTWTDMTSDNQGYHIQVHFDTAGVYTMQFSGRSRNHMIDRIVLHHLDSCTIYPKNLNFPETRCGELEKRYYADSKIYRVKEMKEKCIIDGNESNQIWGGMDVSKGFFEANGSTLPSYRDISYSFKLAFDTTYLYVLADVFDINPITSGDNGTNYENYDNIELFFNPDLKHFEHGDYGDDAIQIRMNYGVENSPFSGKGTWKGNPGYTGFEYISADTEDGYIIEGKIPWSGILGENYEIEIGNKLGFEIMVNDNDLGDHIESSIAWANNLKKNNADSDTRLFGEIILAKNSWTWTNSTHEMENNKTQLKVYLSDANTLKVTGLKQNETTIRIINTIGQVMMQSASEMTESIIDVAELPHGVYVLHTNLNAVLFVK